VSRPSTTLCCSPAVSTPSAARTRASCSLARGLTERGPPSCRLKLWIHEMLRAERRCLGQSTRSAAAPLASGTTTHCGGFLPPPGSARAAFVPNSTRVTGRVVGRADLHDGPALLRATTHDARGDHPRWTRGRPERHRVSTKASNPPQGGGTYQPNQVKVCYPAAMITIRPVFVGDGVGGSSVDREIEKILAPSNPKHSGGSGWSRRDLHRVSITRAPWRR
jgi:hypothetical protein